MDKKKTVYVDWISFEDFEAGMGPKGIEGFMSPEKNEEFCYERRQEERQAMLIVEKPEIFGEGVETGVLYAGKPKDFIMKKEYGAYNLFQGIRQDAIDYFNGLGKLWWKGKKVNGVILPTGDAKASQIACLNHLFPIRNDADAVLAVLKAIAPEYEFVRVLEIPECCEDKSASGYIAFEVDINCLNETGKNCTRIDALLYAEDKAGKVWIVPIEWEYSYKINNCDNYYHGKKKITYDGLINSSAFLKHVVEGGNDMPGRRQLYYKNFFQQMRHTLWGEVMVRERRGIVADGYLHLHVVPNDNLEYRRGGKTEEEWRSVLTEEGNRRYIMADPKELFQPIIKDKRFSEKYSELLDYLELRYW